MARKGLIENNKKRQKLVLRLKSKRLNLKSNIYNKDLSLDDRFGFMVRLAKLPRNSAAIRVRNRCALTGRSRGYCRKMGLSRNMLRDFAAQGLLPGVVKASW
jgi:small subunit ribosomal protein S14